MGPTPNDPKQFLRSETGGLNRWIARYPLRAPLTGFAFAGAIFAFLYITDFIGGPLLLIGTLIAITSSFMLVYGLIRIAVGVFTGRR